MFSLQAVLLVSTVVLRLSERGDSFVARRPLSWGSCPQIQSTSRYWISWGKGIGVASSSRETDLSSAPVSEKSERTQQQPRRFDNRYQKPNGNRGGGGNVRPYDGNSNNRRRVGGGRGGGGGGGGGPQALKLVNPMKLQRIVDQIPLTAEERVADAEAGASGGPRRRNDNNNRPVATVGTGQPRQQRQQKNQQQQQKPSSSESPSYDYEYGSTSSGRVSFDGGVGATVAPAKDFGGRKQRGGPGGGVGQRQERPGGRKRGKAGKGQDDGGGRNRRASLRVGTGKKGRGAELRQRRGSLKRRDRTAEKEAKAEAALERKTVSLPDGPLSVGELAEIIDEKPVSIIKFLMTDLGVMASITQSLDQATCIAVAEGFGKVVGGADDELDEELMEVMAEESALSTGVVVEDDDPEDLLPRAPVVTIMGHVDHGKTSLLDAVRNTDVTAGEAGGITQHIAAYQVKHDGKSVTFIDTPGHAAFTDMRERGANITDLVILVVAADDGVKQQTADSIACARQAGVPLVVAINKCDLDAADPVKVMTELTGYDILTEEFGGEVLSAQISARDGTNIDDLLDKVMLQAELQDLKANPDREAEGIIVEANVERGLGTVATTLVKKGTLRVGDVFVAGETHGRVRALLSTADGKTRLSEAGPSVPVRVVGFEGVPAAGDILVHAPDEPTARELAENRQRIARERQSSRYQAGLMDSVAMTFGGDSKERREMCVVVKADVQGSAEALTRALRELKRENDEAVVTVKVLVSEAGEVSKSDIAIASVTPGTTVLAFGVPASFAAMEDARAAGVPIEFYNIVYDAIESVESRMQEVLSPTPDGEYIGAAVVQEVFNIGGTGNIAGSRCTDGLLKRGGNVRVMRGDKILVESRIKSLRNFKAEADSIEEGNECGIGLVEFEEFEPGDVIECYVE